MGVVNEQEPVAAGPPELEPLDGPPLLTELAPTDEPDDGDGGATPGLIASVGLRSAASPLPDGLGQLALANGTDLVFPIGWNPDPLMPPTGESDGVELKLWFFLGTALETVTLSTKGAGGGKNPGLAPVHLKDPWGGDDATVEVYDVKPGVATGPGALSSYNGLVV